MNLAKSLSCVSTLALLIAGPLSAQEAGDAAGVGEGLQAIAEKGNITLARLSVGKSALVINEHGEWLATISDHVIDQKSGSIAFIIVDVPPGAEETRSLLVPFEKFTWNAKERRLKLHMTQEVLGALPEYDPATLQALGQPEKDAEGKQPLEAGDDVGCEAKPQRFMLGTHLVKARINAQDKPFCSVSEILIDPTKNRIAFLAAQGKEEGNDPYVIPFDALKWAERPEGVRQLTIGLSLSDLADAPRVKTADLRLLEKKELIARIRSFYLLEPMPRERPGGRDVKG